MTTTPTPQSIDVLLESRVLELGYADGTVLALPFDLDGVRVQVSASVGAALFPDHGDDIATLVACADSAMYAAKKAGKNRFCYYAPD